MSIQKQLHLYSSGWQNMSARCSVERSWGGGWPFGEGWGWCQHSWFSQYHTSLTVCLYSSQCHTSHLSVLQSVPHFPSVCLSVLQSVPHFPSVCTPVSTTLPICLSLLQSVPPFPSVCLSLLQSVPRFPSVCLYSTLCVLLILHLSCCMWDWALLFFTVFMCVSEHVQVSEPDNQKSVFLVPPRGLS